MVSFLLFLGCNPPELPDPFNKGNGVLYDGGTSVESSPQEEEDSGAQENNDSGQESEDTSEDQDTASD